MGGRLQWMMSTVEGERVNNTRTCNVNMCPGTCGVCVLGGVGVGGRLQWMVSTVEGERE